MIAVRSGGSDLIVMIDQACNVGQVKCRPSNQWEDRRRGTRRYQMTLRNV